MKAILNFFVVIIVHYVKFWKKKFVCSVFVNFCCL